MDRLLTNIHSSNLQCSRAWLYLVPRVWSTHYFKVFGSTLSLKDFSLEFEMSRVEPLSVGLVGTRHSLALLIWNVSSWEVMQLITCACYLQILTLKIPGVTCPPLPQQQSRLTSELFSLLN